MSRSTFVLIVASFLPLALGIWSTPLQAAGALRSSPITITPDGQHVVVINPDSNSLSVVDISSLRVTLEIPVGSNPQTLSLDSSGKWAFVTNKDDDTVSVVDLEAGELITNLPVGDEPFGVVVGQGGRVYVANTGSGTVQIIDQSTWDTLATIPVETGPRGLALSLDERSLYVTHFQSGKLSIVNTDTFNVEAVISTGPDSNVSQSILLDPASELAYLPHTRSNATNQALLFDTTVFPVVSVVDLSTGEHLRSKRIFLDIVDMPVNLPLDAALTSSGKLYVVNAGSNDISVIDLNARSAVAHLEVGDNPRGVVLSPDEKTLYVSNTLRGTVSIIETLTDQVVGEIVLTQIPLPPDFLNGKILFNTSARADMAKDQWISCATCHFDAKMDGRTWFSKDGPRNTPNLSGVKDTLPIHWSGDLDELQDVEATIRNRQAGTGLASGPLNCDPACDQGPPNAGRSKDLDDLAVYMRALTFGPNPNLTPDGTLTETAERGQALFLSQETACASCHIPPLYTDLQKHDVGTATSPLEAKGSAFDTPSLRGIYQTAPYLHDGTAEILLDVLTAHNPEDRHGVTSHLTTDQLQDLVQFLLALPYEIPVEGFAQFGNGEDISSTFILVNPSSSQPATGTVSLFDSEGKALATAINGQTQKGSFSFKVPAAAAGFYQTDGVGDLLMGSARLTSNIALGGTILFAGEFGVAGVGAARSITDFLVPIESDTSEGVQTGLALANPSDSNVEVIVTLRRADGTPVPDGSISISLSPNGRLAQFPEQILEGRGIDFSSFRGSIDVSSPEPIMGMAIRVSPGQFATLPVTDPTTKSRILHFAQFGDGQGITSTLILVNPSLTQAASGTAKLFLSDGNPLSVDINGTVQNGSFDFSLPPRGIGFYGTDGLGDLRVGSVQLTSTLPVDGTILFAGNFGAAGVGSVDRMARFLVPIESDASRQVQTGVALANPISSSVEITLTLRDADGVPVPNGSASVTLSAHGQLAQFPEEIFAGKEIDFSNFRGTLEVRASMPVVGTAIRVSPGEFATLPVTRMN
ncbi:beta-propeller fold lactonase family protein [Acidobacteria bacterium AH-259-O06]|nr:beta-propeller fold lactonase family protein [Acidobacteria bacterium AH-259-O06]